MGTTGTTSRARLTALQQAADAASAGVSAGWFETEVRPHLPALHRQALRLTRHPERAEDLLQDTLERGYRKRRLFRPGTNVRAWLAAVMRNVWISSHRRRVHEPGIISLDALDELTLGRDAANDDAGTSVVEQMVIDGMGESAILGVIASLPPTYRDVVMLADVHEMPYKVIAERLQIPVGSVCSRLSRGRERIRRVLRKRGYDAA